MAWALAVAIGTAGMARADGPVVVELFTSQGCSSCPPADELLADLAGRDDVIALALHVDYWDYIGWADTFADPAYTARQHHYARAAGSTVVYTPQMVIEGQDHVIGHRPMEVMDAVLAHAAQASPVSVSVQRTGDGYTVRANANGAPRRDMVVQLVGYRPHARVDIRRGENADRSIDYHNIVSSWQVIANWDGGNAFQSQIRPQSDLEYVVIVQESGYGPILAAARLR
ncbi:DUF1223 domain-containing protein [Rhodobacterales bacterium HKCCE3408]|nr:DUF1223 domain-containing protein [Rhodobacterales bacterium HKCCE3408]